MSRPSILPVQITIVKTFYYTIFLSINQTEPVPRAQTCNKYHLLANHYAVSLTTTFPKVSGVLVCKNYIFTSVETRNFASLHPHPTPSTPSTHPTPHTLHPTPHTPHPTPHTPHPTNEYEVQDVKWLTDRFQWWIILLSVR